MVGTGEPKAIISSCPECAEKSREGSLKEYNISLEETVVLCDNSSVSISLDNLSVYDTVLSIRDLFNAVSNVN